MKKLVYLFPLLFLLNSCFGIYFDQPQPKGGIRLENVLEELQGKWLDGDDTIYLGSDGLYGYSYDSLTMHWTKDSLFLSYSLQLYKAGTYYVVNLGKIENNRQWWTVELIKRKENGDIYFYYPQKAPYFGKGRGLKVIDIDQELDPVMLNDSVGRKRHVWNKKSLSMKHVMTRNAVYYSGQFRIKDIPKVLIPENIDFIYRADGTVEHLSVIDTIPTQ